MKILKLIMTITTLAVCLGPNCKGKTLGCGPAASHAANKEYNERKRQRERQLEAERYYQNRYNFGNGRNVYTPGDQRRYNP